MTRLALEILGTSNDDDLFFFYNENVLKLVAELIKVTPPPSAIQNAISTLKMESINDT